MNINQLLESWCETPKPRIVTLTTKTLPELLKKNRITGEPNPFGKITRICRRNGVIGCSYESCVNRQRAREEHEDYFTASELWNGKGQHDSPYTVKHVEKGTRYVCFKPKQKPNGELVINADAWLADGTPINEVDIRDWLKSSQPSKRQELEKPVFWRTIGLENILAVSCDGQEIELES